jgi:hypothetical protein
MKKYRKRPIIVEVEQFIQGNMDRCFNFVTCNKYADLDKVGNPIFAIETLEGIMVAQLGDYIIKGVRGEFYPCNPDVFKETYDLIEED